MPADESHPVRPLSPYGASKAAAEAYVCAISRLSGIRYTILRYGNVYGPRQDPSGEAGVVAIFTRAMLNGERPTVFGDGQHERDYVYVADVVEANTAALSQNRDGVFNIGTGEGTTVSQVFQAVAEATGYAGEPAYAEARPGDVRRIYLDASLAERELDWRPRVPFAEGIRRTVDSMRGQP